MEPRWGGALGASGSKGNPIWGAGAGEDGAGFAGTGLAGSGLAGWDLPGVSPIRFRLGTGIKMTPRKLLGE